MSDVTYEQLRQYVGRNIICPAHDDHEPSLHVSLGKDGETIVIKCHASCRSDEILTAWGIDYPDLFPPHLRKPSRRDNSNANVPSSSRSRCPVPNPIPNPVDKDAATDGRKRKDEERYMRLVMREWREGKRIPTPPRALTLPPNAPPLAAAIYNDMLVRWGLRLGAEMPEKRALPYVPGEAVREGFTTSVTMAGKALTWLKVNDLIWRDETAKDENGAPMRIPCWLPGPEPVRPFPDSARYVEAAVGVADGSVAVEQPRMEVEDDGPVTDAEIAAALCDLLGTSADGADPDGGR